MYSTQRDEWRCGWRTAYMGPFLTFQHTTIKPRTYLFHVFSYWKSIFRFECANNLPVPTLSQYTTPVTMDHSIQTSTNMVLLLQLWIFLALQSPRLSSLLDFSTPPFSFNHFCTSVDVVSTQDCRLHTSVCCTVHLNKLRLTITSWKIPQMVRIVWTQAETTAKA